jgi:hypothetical protein
MVIVTHFGWIAMRIVIADASCSFRVAITVVGTINILDVRSADLAKF